MRTALRSNAATAVVAASLVACGGAGAQPTATLEPAKVSALKLVAVGGKTTFCPHGPPVQLQAIAALDGGSSLATWSDGESREGRLDFTAFEWTASHGQVDGEGRVRLADDPFPLLEQPLVVTARVSGRPEVEAKLELSPSWRCSVRVDRSGAPGAVGSSGAAGVNGRPGRVGDALMVAAGGELGEPGGAGGDGGAGRPAAAVDVAVGWVSTAKHGRLVLVRVNGRPYLFDPSGGARAEVVADGGRGGQGGAGGAGGAGGDGGAGKVKEGTEGPGAEGGAGGAGGRGGAGGDGASVRVQYDARDPALVGMVRISNRGGAGGPGGPGGRGGAGGKGGASSTGGRGPDAKDGKPGTGGATGQTGRPGQAIPSPPADARALFADEIGRGVPVIVE